MKRYIVIVASIAAFFLTGFIIVEILGVPLLSDPSPWMGQGELMAAVVGVGLLFSDVLLPIPSSLIMVAHGALFGVWMGTLLSLLGSVSAALCGFAIGRRGGRMLNRLVTKEERLHADKLLSRWGVLTIIITRPVPILAETVSIVAGTSSLGWGSAAIAALAGSLPSALLYAITGAMVVNLQSMTLVFGIVILITALIWLIGHRFFPRILYSEYERN